MYAAPSPTSVALTYPGYLVLLAVLPLIIAFSLRPLSALGPARRPIAIGLRCVVIALIALALAGPEWVRTTDDQAVAFALDRSDSVPAARQREALAFVERASAAMRPGKDRIATLSFAGRPTVEQLQRESLIVRELGSVAEGHRTNIAAALRLGMALFPSDFAKRLVLISDGNENRGIAAHEAEAYAALGVPIDVLPLRREPSAEILVEQLSAPASVARDEVIHLQLIVRSQVDTTGRLTLYRNDRMVDLDPAPDRAASTLRLAAGPSRFSIPVTLPAAGVHRFRAVIEPDNPATDSLVMNNVGEAVTIAGDAARVLVVFDPAGGDAATDESSAALLTNTLRAGGVDCDLITLDALPGEPAALADTSAVVLSNVSAFALGPSRQEMLASYVRDQGGGLVVVGGDQSFSVGGYARTPLEAILPVETSRDKLTLLSLGMVLVIDRSGSMAGEKLAMACQAAVASVNLLGKFDRIGVIAFDSEPEWVVPMQRATDIVAIRQRLAMIGGGGGTNLYPALQQAQGALLALDSNVKHMIVLTDGQSTPGDFETLADRCGASGITISTIAVGQGADRALLEGVARRSGGRMYVAESARPLPQLFSRETVLASRSGCYERPFTPQRQQVADEQIVAGLPAEVPPLRGHVVTAAKPLAHAPLVRVTEEGVDPILAYWPVGAGRAVAFTSGLWSKWGPEWVAWSGFSKFWTQAVRYAERQGNRGELEVVATVDGGDARVSISAEHLSPLAQGTLAVTGQVVSPDFSSSPLALHRSAAGRYDASFSLDAPGTYLLSLPYSYGTGAESRSGVLHAGVVQSYSPEYRTLTHDEATLTELARRTGGRVLSVSDSAAVFESSIVRPVQVRRPAWEDCVRLALLLFVLDVAVRRIALRPATAAARLRRAIGELAGARVGADSAATLGALRGAKERTLAAAERTAAVEPRHDDSLSRALQGGGGDEPVVARPSRRASPAATDETEYAARLLRAKRRARQEEIEGDGR